MVKVCRNCERSIEDDDNFCRYCGKDVRYNLENKNKIDNIKDYSKIEIDEKYIDRQKDADVIKIVNNILVNCELRKITPTLLFRMVKARKRYGWTYDKIQNSFHVSKWTAINYLRDVKPDVSTIHVSEEFNKKIEKRATTILINEGFKDIINLGELCPRTYFDFLAIKGKQKWLLNITVGDSTELRNKTLSLRVIPGFICAILYMTGDLGSYNLVELKSTY